MSVTAYYIVVPTETQTVVIGAYMAVSTVCLIVILALLYKNLRYTRRISRFIDIGMEGKCGDEEEVRTPGTARTSDDVFAL